MLAQLTSVDYCKKYNKNPEEPTLQYVCITDTKLRLESPYLLLKTALNPVE